MALLKCKTTYSKRLTLVWLLPLRSSEEMAIEVQADVSSSSWVQLLGPCWGSTFFPLFIRLVGFPIHFLLGMIELAVVGMVAMVVAEMNFVEILMIEL